MPGIAAGDDDLADLADPPGVDGAADRGEGAVEAAVEGQHHPAAHALDLGGGAFALGDVEVDRLLAEHRLAELDRLQEQADMGVGRRADHHGIDVRPGDRRHRIAHRLGAERLRQRLDRLGERIGDGDELRLGVRRDAGGVDLADAPCAENCNSNHRCFLVVLVVEAHCARVRSAQSAGRLTARNCCIVASNARCAAISSGRWRW